MDVNIHFIQNPSIKLSTKIVNRPTKSWNFENQRFRFKCRQIMSLRYIFLIDYHFLYPFGQKQMGRRFISIAKGDKLTTF